MSPSSKLTVMTGSVWPPYPGAGQGYWAARAGFYKAPTALRNKITTTTTLQQNNTFVINRQVPIKTVP